MPARSFLVCQPDQTVPAGAMQRELSSSRCPVTLVRCYQARTGQTGLFDPEHYAGLIILGGGDKSADIRGRYLTEKNYIKQAVAHGKPVFGICLGAQLLALECGGSIERRSRILDKGWKNVILTRAGVADPVLKYLKDGVRMYQHHHDRCVFPSTCAAQELAKSSDAQVEHCEGFRFGNSYGVQFHPEVTKDILSQWKVKDLPDESLRIGQTMISAWIRLALGEPNPALQPIWPVSSTVMPRESQDQVPGGFQIGS